MIDREREEYENKVMSGEWIVEEVRPRDHVTHDCCLRCDKKIGLLAHRRQIVQCPHCGLRHRTAGTIIEIFGPPPKGATVVVRHERCKRLVQPSLFLPDTAVSVGRIITCPICQHDHRVSKDWGNEPPLACYCGARIWGAGVKLLALLPPPGKARDVT